MTTAFAITMNTMTVAVIGVLLAPSPVAAQTRDWRTEPIIPAAPTWVQERAKLPPYDPPRTADGHPDLQGFWLDRVDPDDAEARPAALDETTPAHETFIADPPDGKIPYQPWALAKRNEIRAGLGRGWPGEGRERLHISNTALCIAGVPRFVMRGTVEIVQPRGGEFVIMLLNWGGFYRVIPMDDRPRIGSEVKLFMGSARGRWEGDTLVVETTNLNGKVWFDNAGNFFSNGARAIERFRLADANTIDWQVTMEDPKVYTQPWTISVPLRRTRAGGAGADVSDPHADETWEQACYEGNRVVPTLIDLGFKFFTGVVPPD